MHELVVGEQTHRQCSCRWSGDRGAHLGAFVAEKQFCFGGNGLPPRHWRTNLGLQFPRELTGGCWPQHVARPVKTRVVSSCGWGSGPEACPSRLSLRPLVAMVARHTKPPRPFVLAPTADATLRRSSRSNAAQGRPPTSFTKPHRTFGLAECPAFSGTPPTPKAALLQGRGPFWPQEARENEADTQTFRFGDACSATGYRHLRPPPIFCAIVGQN